MFSASRSVLCRTAVVSSSRRAANLNKTGSPLVQKQSQQHLQQRRKMGSDMPVPQSQNAELWSGHTVKHEGWEYYIYFYYTAGLFLQAAVLLGAPETSIESWARPEAKARLYLASEAAEAANGGIGGDIEFAFGTHYQDLVKTEQRELWTKFSDRAINPGEDDDDDDEDDDDDDDDDDDEEEDEEEEDDEE